MDSQDKKDEKHQAYSKVPSTKKSRAHKKQMYINIKSQMEFYFSSSNLSKDRFLKKKIEDSEENFVPLSTFLTFNKLKILLNSIPEERQMEMLIKSISKSEVLELNDEGKSVRLKGEIIKKDQNEIDECTIYVEQIPLNSNHENIKSIFSKYGQINYISLPRFKKSRQLKQFGFIEFAEKESVLKSLVEFAKFDGVLHNSKPEKLISIVTYENETKTAEDVEIKEVEEEKKEDVELKEVEDEKQQTDSEQKKKKNRKHKRKNKKQKLIDERAVTMKIMRKTLWKKLRNEYLNLERRNAKEIKKMLQETRKPNPKEQLAKFSPVSPRIEAISFYKSPSGRDQSESVSEGHHEGIENRPIVNIKFREPCNDLKELKQEFRQFSYVQHVEIIENGSQCNVRVAAQSYAQELVNLYSGCEYEANVISGDAEKEYWLRITENKEKNKKKTENNPNRKQRRGREKLAKMIIKASSQHIRFNDSAEPVE